MKLIDHSTLAPATWALLSRLWNRLRFLRGNHQRNIASARRVLARIATFDSAGAVLAYLRKIDPDVFEELVLELFEREGVPVLRNRSYSGDHGIDGHLWLPGTGLVLVQCKRYRAHIDRAHVADFARVMASRARQYGVFVHTGRTGEAAYAEAAGRIRFLSGFVLAEIASGQASSSRWLTDALSMCGKPPRQASLALRRS